MNEEESCLLYQVLKNALDYGGCLMERSGTRVARPTSGPPRFSYVSSSPSFPPCAEQARAVPNLPERLAPSLLRRVPRRRGAISLLQGPLFSLPDGIFVPAVGSRSFS